MVDRELHQEGADNSLEGKGRDLKGRVKDAAGGLTGDSDLQAEGKWDRVKGKVQEKIGDAQRKIARDTESDQI